MKRKSLYSVLLIAIAILSVSCSKDKFEGSPDIQSQGLLDLKTFNQFLDQKTNGIFYLTNSVPVASQKLDNIATCDGQFFSNSLKSASDSNAIAEGGRAIIGDIVLNLSSLQTRSASTDEKKSADHLFGSNVGFQLNPPASMLKSATDATINDTMYVPEKLLLNEPKLTYVVGGDNSDLVYSGQTFTWNADANNTKGVIIIVTYDPEDGSTPVRNAITVVDNGSCQLSDILFQGVPHGKVVTVEVCRGNFKYSTDASVSNTYSLYSYTLVSFGAVYK